MTYLEKYNKIVQKLVITNFELFEGKKEDAFFVLNMRLNSLIDYCKSIYVYNLKIQQLKLLYDREEYRFEYEKMDGKRHNLHNMAIESLKGLNDLSNKLELGNFTDINTDDRKEVGREIGRIVEEIAKYELEEK